MASLKIKGRVPNYGRRTVAKVGTTSTGTNRVRGRIRRRPVSG